MRVSATEAGNRQPTRNNDSTIGDMIWKMETEDDDQNDPIEEMRKTATKGRLNSGRRATEQRIGGFEPFLMKLCRFFFLLSFRRLVVLIVVLVDSLILLFDSFRRLSTTPPPSLLTQATTAGLPPSLLLPTTPTFCCPDLETSL